MSKINALNSSEIAFQGKSKVEVKEAEEKPKKGFAKVVGKITQPVKDEFEKAYGEDVKPDAALVADFTADNIMKLGVGVGITALTLAKMRKSTNGLTKALKEGFSNMKVKKAATEAVADGADAVKSSGKVKSIIKTIREAFSEVKANNLKNANEAAEAVKNGEGGSVFASIKKSILKPKEVDDTSKLSKFIDKHFGPETKIGKFINSKIKVAEGAEPADAAKLAKKGLAQVGIADTADLVDTAAAVGATAVVGSTANEITDDVVDNDNQELAKKSTIKRFEGFLNTADKLADTAALFGV